MTQKDSLATRRLVVNRLGIFILLLGVVNRFGQILARRFNGRRHQRLSAGPRGTSLPYGPAAHRPDQHGKSGPLRSRGRKAEWPKNNKKSSGNGPKKARPPDLS